MTRRQKPLASSSSRMRSTVTPVNADTGFIVMLPQSLYQMSCWMRSETRHSKPAAVSIAREPRRPGRMLPPAGSPMMRPWPMTFCTTPGSGVLHDACTTQPTTLRAGIARAIAPSGSSVRELHARARARHAVEEPPLHAVHRRQHHVSGPSERRDACGDARASPAPSPRRRPDPARRAWRGRSTRRCAARSPYRRCAGACRAR